MKKQLTRAEAIRFTKKPAYQRRRKALLQENPLCVRCLEKGLVVPATVADHVVPHNHDLNELMLGKLQALCKLCHDASKRTEELRGYRTEVGADGYPVDRRHPCYSAKQMRNKREKVPSVSEL
jgi:5-methylcytosine-specific restriction endonuclease McrA